MSPPTAMTPHSGFSAAPRTSSFHPHPNPPMQRNGSRDDLGHPSVSLPPLRLSSTTPPTPSSDRRPGNPLGVQSILNPQADLMEQQRGRRRTASQMESPSPVDTHPSHSLPSISRPTSVESVQDEPVPQRQFQPPSIPSRHILSPRSSALHRTRSLGVLKPPTGTIDAYQSPFLSATTRPHAPDAAPPLPTLSTPPVTGRVTYFPTATAPMAPTPPPGMVRTELRRPSIGFPQSGSASPITSFSPFSQAASVSSSQIEGNSQPGSYMTMHSNTQGQEYTNPPITMETERNLIPMAPSGQSTIQMMTIKSQQGHHVQIPVDVQAASKVADEKRKRNAGASARFRARRKEKEREASMSITRLEQQLREAIEDIDYYRCERDYFKSIAYQQPGAERHYPRAPSPRLRRPSVAPSNAASSTGGAGSGSSYSGYEDHDPRETERNVRRRTSSYHPAPGHAHEHVNGNTPQPPNYASAAFGSSSVPPTAQPPNRPVHLQQSEPQDPRTLADLRSPMSQRPILRDPFAADASRYDNRNWTPVPRRDTRG